MDIQHGRQLARIDFKDGWHSFQKCLKAQKKKPVETTDSHLRWILLEGDLAFGWSPPDIEMGIIPLVTCRISPIAFPSAVLKFKNLQMGTR